MPASLAHLTAVLRAKNLDRTLTSALWERRTTADLVPTEVPAFDAPLSGGFPRGEVSEVVGPPTSGRTTLVLRALAAATRRGELVALVDALDRLDVRSAAATGLDLDRVLWIRGHVTAHPGPCRHANLRALEQAVKALTLVLHAGLCDLTVFDLADAPPRLVRALPMTTWLRLHRMIEGSRSVCLLVGQAPLWHSPGGMTVQMTADAWTASSDPRAPSHARLFSGLTLRPRVIRARIPDHASLCLPVSTTCV